MKGTITLTQDPNKKYAVAVLAVAHNINEDKTALLHCHFDKIPANVLPVSSTFRLVERAGA